MRSGAVCSTADSLQFVHTEWRFCVQVKEAATVRKNGALREPEDTTEDSAGDHERIIPGTLLWIGHTIQQVWDGLYSSQGKRQRNARPLTKR